MRAFEHDAIEFGHLMERINETDKSERVALRSGWAVPSERPVFDGEP